MIHKQLNCPECGGKLDIPWGTRQAAIPCPDCGWQARIDDYVLAVDDYSQNQTSEHYTLQWGPAKDFHGFMQQNQKRRQSTPASQLGWDALFAEIRARAAHEPVWVYDAACGFGAIAHDLLDGPPAHLYYLGADIHAELGEIGRRLAGLDGRGQLLRHSIDKPLPFDLGFDYVICRASLHHTPEPEKTMQNLAGCLAPGGVMAISVYRKKSLLREALDDYLRERITKLPPDEAFALARQFTLLGKYLRECEAKVTVEEDLPFFGIKSGEYPVQGLIYDHFLKCFYNPEWGEEGSDVVNFDWYHPPYAYRYSDEEARALFTANGLGIRKEMAVTAQIYLEGRKEPAS